MRWASYFILAYLALGIQIGAGEFLRVGGAKPDLVLLAVIYIAINAPREAALGGAFGMGLMVDLVGLGPLGLYAFAYGLVAMFVVSMQEVVYREHPMAHLLDRKSTRLNSSHSQISYAVFCLKKKIDE